MPQLKDSDQIPGLGQTQSVDAFKEESGDLRQSLFNQINDL